MSVFYIFRDRSILFYTNNFWLFSYLIKWNLVLPIIKCDLFSYRPSEQLDNTHPGMCQVKFYFHFQKVHFFSLKFLIFAHNHTYIIECLLLHIFNGCNFNWLLYVLSFPSSALFMYSIAAVKKINRGFLGKYSFQKLGMILISAISLASRERIAPF